jgi:hypothetical protein
MYVGYSRLLGRKWALFGKNSWIIGCCDLGVLYMFEKFEQDLFENITCRFKGSNECFFFSFLHVLLVCFNGEFGT